MLDRVGPRHGRQPAGDRGAVPEVVEFGVNHVQFSGRGSRSLEDDQVGARLVQPSRQLPVVVLLPRSVVVVPARSLEHVAQERVVVRDDRARLPDSRQRRLFTGLGFPLPLAGVAVAGHAARVVPVILELAHFIVEPNANQTGMADQILQVPHGDFRGQFHGPGVPRATESAGLSLPLVIAELLHQCGPFVLRRLLRGLTKAIPVMNQIDAVLEGFVRPGAVHVGRIHSQVLQFPTRIQTSPTCSTEEVAVEELRTTRGADEEVGACQVLPRTLGHNLVLPNAPLAGVDGQLSLFRPGQLRAAPEALSFEREPQPLELLRGGLDLNDGLLAAHIRVAGETHFDLLCRRAAQRRQSQRNIQGTDSTEFHVVPLSSLVPGNSWCKSSGSLTRLRRR